MFIIIDIYIINLDLMKVIYKLFFSGPAFYAWQRMKNIQGMGGPLRQETITQQYQL